MALPPLLAGDVKPIAATVSPGVAVPMVGAPGAVAEMMIGRVTCNAAS